jgi:hypothetical protein
LLKIKIEKIHSDAAVASRPIPYLPAIVTLAIVNKSEGRET